MYIKKFAQILAVRDVVAGAPPLFLYIKRERASERARVLVSLSLTSLSLPPSDYSDDSE